MKPTEYLELKRQKEAEIEKLEQEIQAARDEAMATPPPDNLQPAVASDIALGAIIWEEVGPDPDYPTEWGFFVVEEVLRPDDEWKAYVTNGCRRGLYGAFVENNQEQAQP